MNAQAIVIGVSAGAVETLTTVLTPLPANYPLPIIIVVHIPAHKESVLASLFGAKCQMRVREAEDKEMLEPGTIYFAPPGYHLLIEQDKSLSLSNEEEILFSRPSIDVLFESAADAYGDGLIGIVLTGANEDGAKGLQEIVVAKGRAVVQDPESAVAAAMPQAALKLCPDALVIKPAEISLYIIEAAPYKEKHAV